MSFSVDFISGVMVGIEFTEDEVGGTGMVLDLFIIRILVA